MSILSDSAILSARKKGDIVITPFDPKNLGSNSYDVTLAGTMAVYEKMITHWHSQPKSPTLYPYESLPKREDYLDAKENNKLDYFDIPDEGLILYPNILYLAVTNEYTESHIHRPKIEGKSSVGRLGIANHVTAGYGDVGFCGHWTLEIQVIHPIRVKKNMLIGQIEWSTVEGEVLNPYNKKPSAKYNNGYSEKPMPMGSGMWKKFRKGEEGNGKK